MSTAVELPEDVWRCITGYLQYYELHPLLGVNRILFNVVLDERYKEVRWEKLDRATALSLKRLKDPMTARRVRRLHIRAWFIDYLARKDKLVKPQSYAPVQSRGWFGDLVGMPPPPPSKTFTQTGDASARDMLESMTEVIELMTGVTDYSFEWCGLAPTPDTMRFVSAARMSFGNNLRKLCLNAQISNFGSLLATYRSLEELELTFDYGEDSWETPTFLRKTFAPWINRFSESLLGLKITSTAKSDLTPLFESLGKFFALRRFSVALPFDYPKEPDAILAILQTHTQSLRTVEFTLLPSSEIGPELRPASAWPAFSTALAGDRVSLSSVRSLRLPHAPSPIGAFTDSLSTIRRCTDTLTRLVLADIFLDLLQLENLLRLFGRRRLDSGLEKLHIGVAEFPLHAFELLVKYTPNLDTLYLVLTQSCFAELGSDQSETFATLVAGLGAVTQDWRLRDVGIWLKRFVDPTTSSPADESSHYLAREEDKISQFLRMNISSVRTVRGRYWHAASP
ncbi:hypothetical protein MKEN_00174900 [Mycena kentingensis (nom. inval.)]|nr:hypothetical protein MKEN_00174900 [Mycena kentingensis (nom. inval.)]